MIIVYNDGSVLECNKIEFYGTLLYCDEVNIVDLCDVDHIETA